MHATNFRNSFYRIKQKRNRHNFVLSTENVYRKSPDVFRHVLGEYIFSLNRTFTKTFDGHVKRTTCKTVWYLFRSVGPRDLNSEPCRDVQIFTVQRARDTSANSSALFSRRRFVPLTFRRFRGAGGKIGRGNTTGAAGVRVNNNTNTNTNIIREQVTLGACAAGSASDRWDELHYVHANESTRSARDRRRGGVGVLVNPK